MKATKLIFIFLFPIYCSCGQKVHHKVDPLAVRLNDQAIGLMMTSSGNKDSSIKAIVLLDSATKIDSNYFQGYYNKLILVNEQHMYDKGIQTVNHLIRINPNANELYLTAGMLHVKTKDSAMANTYFKKSLSICNSVLDTMNESNKSYFILTMNKAIDIILLGDSTKGNHMLTQLYNKQNDDAYKQLLVPFLNKGKREIIEEAFNPKPVTSTVESLPDSDN